MDSKHIIISNFCNDLTKTQKTISLLLSLTISALVLSLLLTNNCNPFFSPHSRNPSPSPSLSLSFINIACSKTLYPSLCRSSLSSFNNNSTTITILQFSINQTLIHVNTARITILHHFAVQDLTPPHKNALQDCMDLLDQTRYELDSAMAVLESSHFPRSYGSVNTLLSAAMTYEYTCINGFLDLEQLINSDQKSSYKANISHHLQKLLTPVSHMISNSLALIKYVEENQETHVNKMMITKQDYTRLMARRRRNKKKKKAVKNLRPNMIVARDGSGDYDLIGDAVAAAPDMSKKTFVIKINAGVYRENVFIPREKINILLVGDGMNSTIITASRNLADGFSTFESATLTVVGDKFMAKDLTVENTAAPEKHQAVALRVTSNAAFYRCGIISYQDTLYAHSLRQLYQECTIQGTIDFIFGNAAAVFRNCRILVRRPMRGQRNTITAQGREDPNQNTGISLQNCSIEAAADFSPAVRKHFSTYLGRPWRKYARAIVSNSYLGEVVHPRGWLEWPQYSSVETVDYIECMNYGPGAAMRRRVSWAGYRNNCSKEIVKQFAVEEFLHGEDDDDWLESTVMPIIYDS